MTSTTVTARTAADVDALYQRLWNIRPPLTTDAQRAAADAARALAAKRGWRPPLAWDDIDTDPESGPRSARPAPEDVDEIAIERAIAGEGIRLTDLSLAEQKEVIRHLTQRGRSIRDIARQLDTTKRTVSRRRASLGSP